MRCFIQDLTFSFYTSLDLFCSFPLVYLLQADIPNLNDAK